MDKVKEKIFKRKRVFVKKAIELWKYNLFLSCAFIITFNTIQIKTCMILALKVSRIFLVCGKNVNSLLLGYRKCASTNFWV